jgi:hypothetical protein
MISPGAVQSAGSCANGAEIGVAVQATRTIESVTATIRFIDLNQQIRSIGGMGDIDF